MAQLLPITNEKMDTCTHCLGQITGMVFDIARKPLCVCPKHWNRFDEHWIIDLEKLKNNHSINE